MATYRQVQFKHPICIEDSEDEVHKIPHTLTQHFVCWKEETSKRFVGWWEKSAAIFPSLAPPRHHHGNCVKQHSLGEVSVCLGHEAAPERVIKCSSTELVLFEWKHTQSSEHNKHITAVYYTSILQQHIIASTYRSAAVQNAHSHHLLPTSDRTISNRCYVYDRAERAMYVHR